MAGNMQGKAALVTGGSSGIGRATAMLFARKGAKVVVADINAEQGKEAVDIIRTSDGEANFVKTDVSKDQEVQALEKTVDFFELIEQIHD